MADNPNTDDPRLQEAQDRFKLSAEAFKDQRKRELEDLSFFSGDQWPEEIRRQRLGGQSSGGLPPTPPRPILTINKLLQPVQQVCNQQRNARLQLQFAPKGSGATRETAEVMEDIARAIQTDSRAHLARNWAFERMAQCGLGAYRILTDYANDGDFDLDIVYARILNQASVYFDPFATEPDWSDGEWCFITADYSWHRYKREFGKSRLASFDDSELTALGDEVPGWITNGDDPESRAVRVAEYFYKEYEEDRLYGLEDGRNLTQKEAEKEGLDEKTLKGARSRRIRTPKVKWCKLNAVEILEENEWPGRFIPVIPVIGQEMNVNGTRMWQGLVRPAMDAQKSYNYMRSAQVEAIGLAPRAPFIGYAETVEGYEEWWRQANTRNFSFLPIKAARGPDGSALPPPQRDVTEPAIQAITLAAHEADGDVKATTGIFDASLGNINPQDRSGKAILALQKQAEIGSSGYIDNLSNMSMVYEGKILRDLIPKVYDRPGRVVAAVGADDQRRNVMLGTPYKLQGKEPIPADPRDPEAKPPIDLSQGEYSVAVTVGKSYTTKREEAAGMMGELAQAVPQLVQTYADLWVENMDFPGAKQIADRLKKTNPLAQDEGDQQIPPKVQQQLQQQGQMIQMLTQELDAKTKIIDTDEVKAKQEMDKALLDGQVKIRIAEIQANTQFGVAELKAGLEDALARMAHIETIVGHEYEAQRLYAEQAHEAGMAGMQQAHEAGEAQAGRQFEADQSEADREHESGQAAMDRGHEAGMAASQQAHDGQMAKQHAAMAKKETD